MGNSRGLTFRIIPISDISIAGDFSFQKIRGVDNQTEPDAICYRDLMGHAPTRSVAIP